MTANVRSAVIHHIGNGGASRPRRRYIVATVELRASCSEMEVWEQLWGPVGDGLVDLDNAHQGFGTRNLKWCPSGDAQLLSDGRNWESHERDRYPSRIHDGTTDLADLIPLLRKAGGPAAGRQIDRETARAQLTIGPMCQRRVDPLAAHFGGLPAGDDA